MHPASPVRFFARVVLPAVLIAACSGGSGGDGDTSIDPDGDPTATDQPQPGGEDDVLAVCGTVDGTWEFLIDGGEFAVLPSVASVQNRCVVSMLTDDFYLTGTLNEAGEWRGEGAIPSPSSVPSRQILFEGSFRDQLFHGVWVDKFNPLVDGALTAERLAVDPTDTCVAVPSTSWTVTTSAFEQVSLGLMQQDGCSVRLIDPSGAQWSTALQGVMVGRTWAPEGSGIFDVLFNINVQFSVDGTSFEGQATHETFGSVAIFGSYDDSALQCDDVEAGTWTILPFVGTTAQPEISGVEVTVAGCQVAMRWSSASEEFELLGVVDGSSWNPAASGILSEVSIVFDTATSFAGNAMLRGAPVILTGVRD